MTAVGALLGLFISIFLIVKKISPTYSLIAGAILGGLFGGLSLEATVTFMTNGVKDVVPAIIRIMSAGVLTGVLIRSGAAVTISNAIIYRFGERHVFGALAFATMMLCSVGVFIDVAVMTVAPIALSLGRRLGLSPSVLLMAMICGGKCGNIISPNPNTIIAAQNFGVNLSDVMFVNVLPAFVGLVFTVLIIERIMPRGMVYQGGVVDQPVNEKLPSLLGSLAAPIISVGLLVFRPLVGITIDPLIALPVGGVVGLLCMKQQKELLACLESGLQKMSGVAILLIGTGTIAGIVKHSSLKDWILDILGKAHINEVLIAPISGALMSAATASTTAGATLASGSFAETIISVGVAAVWGAAMVNSGATVLDHLPHGSFFHATGGVCELSFKERMKLIPYETLMGFVLVCVTMTMYLILL